MRVDELPENGNDANTVARLLIDKLQAGSPLEASVKRDLMEALASSRTVETETDVSHADVDSVLAQNGLPETEATESDFSILGSLSWEDASKVLRDSVVKECLVTALTNADKRLVENVSIKLSSREAAEMMDDIRLKWNVSEDQIRSARVRIAAVIIRMRNSGEIKVK